jgi:hypothetical protein
MNMPLKARGFSMAARCAAMITLLLFVTGCPQDPDDTDTPNPPPADTIGPVRDLVAVPGDQQVILTWTELSMFNLDYIEITWNGGGDTVAVSPGFNGIGNYTVTGLTNGTSYTFTVTGVALSGVRSSEAKATTIPGLTSVDAVRAYLAAIVQFSSESTPLPVVLSIKEDWLNLLSAINDAARWPVALDLTACSMEGISPEGMFDPGLDNNSGNVWVVSLTLPAAATSIKAGAYDPSDPSAPSHTVSPFRSFVGLRSISGSAVQSVGNAAFYYCNGLTQVNFPQVLTIGDYAFSGCSGLTQANFPQVLTIGDYAFSGCNGLTQTNFLLAETIGDYAFSDCPSLTRVYFPQALTIGDHAFGSSGLIQMSFPGAETIGAYAFFGCTGLTQVDFLLTEIIGDAAFYGCTGLSQVNFPRAVTIGENAFGGCTALVWLDIPLVSTIGLWAFRGTGTGDLTITLGGTPPTTGSELFYNGANANDTKTVIIRRPQAAAANYNTAWQSSFLGLNTAFTLQFVDS